MLITYISEKLCECARMLLTADQSLIVDSSAFNMRPVKVQSGNIIDANRHNMIGEADCSIWHHARLSESSNILIIAND